MNLLSFALEMRLQILPPLFSLKKEKKRKLNFFLFIFNVGDVIFPENGKEKKQKNKNTHRVPPLFSSPSPFPSQRTSYVCVFSWYTETVADPDLSSVASRLPSSQQRKSVFVNVVVVVWLFSLSPSEIGLHLWTRVPQFSR